MEALGIRLFDWMMFIKVRLDYLKEIVGKGKRYSRDVGVHGLRKFFEGPILEVSSNLNVAYGDIQIY